MSCDIFDVAWSTRPPIGGSDLPPEKQISDAKVKSSIYQLKLISRYPAHFLITNHQEIDRVTSALKTSFLSNKTKPVAYRKQQLRKLFDSLEENEEAFQDALARDFGKPAFEVTLTELTTLKTEILENLAALDEWVEDERISVDITMKGTSPYVRKEPLGLALIIGAWNYPLFVTFGPLIGAISAGCAALMKPSELAPYTAAVMQHTINKYLDNDCYRVLNGSVDETTYLLQKKWDCIFYTGGGQVGRIVAHAAAQNLTRCILELGGKNAAIITSHADIPLAAKRIAWGKVTNAGQTCVAPDFVLLTDSTLQEKFTTEFTKAINSFYPNDAWRSAGTFTRIVNKGHFSRIHNLLKETKGKIVHGGYTDESQRLIEPTLVADVHEDDSLMSQEIFGPVLPMVTMPCLKSAISFLQQRDKSLALYIYSNSKSEQEMVIDSVQSGGAMINDNMTHCGITALPFGGVGESGMGAHNGRAGFDAFTHRRTVVRMPKWMEAILGLRYAPYTTSKVSLYRRMATPKAYWNSTGPLASLRRLVDWIGGRRSIFGVLASLILIKMWRS